MDFFIIYHIKGKQEIQYLFNKELPRLNNCILYMMYSFDYCIFINLIDEVKEMLHKFYDVKHTSLKISQIEI